MKKCDCIEKLTKKMKERGLHKFKFENMIGENNVLLPFRYQVEIGKTGELAKKVKHGNYIPLFCPFCGKKLRDRDKSEEDV